MNYNVEIGDGTKMPCGEFSSDPMHEWTCTKTECVKLAERKRVQYKKVTKSLKKKNRKNYGVLSQKAIDWSLKGVEGTMDKCPFCEVPIKVSKILWNSQNTFEHFCKNQK